MSPTDQSAAAADGVLREIRTFAEDYVAQASEILSPEHAMSLTPEKTYRLAICLYPDGTSLDYQGPAEILCVHSTENRRKFPKFLEALKHVPTFAIDPEYLSHTTEPLYQSTGVTVMPTGTYRDAIKSGVQYDMLLIPGGVPTPDQIDPSLYEFIKQQAPKAKHILTVCTGSWLLAQTGLLDGKRATTNKMLYNIVTETTKDRNITWIPKARWVVDDHDDKKIWTSSGVTAGMDMANAFLEYLGGSDAAAEAGAIIEMRFKKEGEDEFAAMHGLV